MNANFPLHTCLSQQLWTIHCESLCQPGRCIWVFFQSFTGTKHTSGLKSINHLKTGLKKKSWRMSLTDVIKYSSSTSAQLPKPLNPGTKECMRSIPQYLLFPYMSLYFLLDTAKDNMPGDTNNWGQNQLKSMIRRAAVLEPGFNRWHDIFWCRSCLARLPGHNWIQDLLGPRWGCAGHWSPLGIWRVTKH